MDNEYRITRMERTLRRQRLAILGLGTALAFVFLGGMQDLPVTELSLRKLTIVDETGRPRLVAEGGTKEPGVATLAHLDNQGIPRIFAGTFPGGTASITVADRLGRGRLVAGTYAGGSASLVAASSEERIRMVTGTRADGSVNMTIYKPDGEVAWEQLSPGASKKAP